jgi:hypothetical protein
MPMHAAFKIRTRSTSSGGCASWHSCRQTARMYWLHVLDQADEDLSWPLRFLSRA